MSFSSRHTITRAQQAGRLARRARGQRRLVGLSQATGTKPRPAPTGEPVLRPVPVEGLEPGQVSPRGQMLICRLCNGAVMAPAARAHIARCWKVSLAPDEPIPMLPTRAAVLRWIEVRRGSGKEKVTE